MDMEKYIPLESSPEDLQAANLELQAAGLTKAIRFDVVRDKYYALLGHAFVLGYLSQGKQIPPDVDKILTEAQGNYTNKLLQSLATAAQSKAKKGG